MHVWRQACLTTELTDQGVSAEQAAETAARVAAATLTQAVKLTITGCPAVPAHVDPAVDCNAEAQVCLAASDCLALLRPEDPHDTATIAANPAGAAILTTCLMMLDSRSSPGDRVECGGMPSRINHFSPRETQTGVEMFAELQRTIPVGTSMQELFTTIANAPTAALSTGFGCHLNYFFYEMQGAAGFGPMMNILMFVSAALAAEDTNPMATFRDTLVPMLVAAVDQPTAGSNLGGFAKVFEMFMCIGLMPDFWPAPGSECTQEDWDCQQAACNDVVGCGWDPVDAICAVDDTARAATAEAFADDMCRCHLNDEPCAVETTACVGAEACMTTAHRLSIQCACDDRAQAQIDASGMCVNHLSCYPVFLLHSLLPPILFSTETRDDVHCAQL